MKFVRRWTVWLAWTFVFVFVLATPVILVPWFLLEWRYPSWYAALWESETPTSLSLAAALEHADRQLRSGNAKRAGDDFMIELDLVAAGVVLPEDAFCYTGQYADIATVVQGALGRTVTPNRVYLGESNGLVLVSGDQAHVIKIFDPPSRTLFISDRRTKPGWSWTWKGSCAPAHSTLVRLSAPVSRHPRVDHMAHIELVDRP